MKSFRRVGTLETPEEAMLLREVEEQNAKVAAFIETVPEDMVALAQTKMLARKLLQFQTQTVTDLAERGLITDTNASELEHQFHTSKREILDMGLKQAASLMSNPLGAVLSPVGAATAAAQAGGLAADMAARPLRRAFSA